MTEIKGTVAAALKRLAATIEAQQAQIGRLQESLGAAVRRCEAAEARAALAAMSSRPLILPGLPYVAPVPPQPCNTARLYMSSGSGSAALPRAAGAVVVGS